MITFIIFYWIFSGFVVLGIMYENYDIDLPTIIYSFLLGGILFPMKMGMALEQIRKINVKCNKTT